jgi:biopolymer transport protein ExbD
VRRKKRLDFESPITDINVTPLVDVCLVLVIIFLVTAPAIYQSGITVSSPKLKQAEEGHQATELKVSIFLSSDGKIFLNEQQVSAQDLPHQVGELLKRSPNKLVIVSAEDNVLHDRVVQILDMAKQKGALRLSVLKRGGAQGVAPAPSGTP